MSAFRTRPAPWRLNFNTLGSDKSPSPILRPCKFGSLCIKFGCPFKHPPSRPRDCPDGEFCAEAKCPLHHPKSRVCVCSEVGTSITPRHSPIPHARSPRTPTRYLNRKIVRSPMVKPSPNSRPTTGYFAATTKPCTRGAKCVKYGCTYKHPPSRVLDCPVGIGCADTSCVRLHPLNEHGTGAIDAGFATGQRVQAKYLPNSAKWSHATILHICGSVLTLQFEGFADTFAVPLRRVRRVRRPSMAMSPRGSPPPTPPPTPRSPPPPRAPSSLPDVEELERLKRAAVTREDFLEAAQIKTRIEHVREIAVLKQRKQKAVCEEDFLLAMDLKNKITDALASMNSSISALTQQQETQSSSCK